MAMAAQPPPPRLLCALALALALLCVGSGATATTTAAAAAATTTAAAATTGGAATTTGGGGGGGMATTTAGGGSGGGATTTAATTTTAAAAAATTTSAVDEDDGSFFGSSLNLTLPDVPDPDATSFWVPRARPQSPRSTSADWLHLIPRTSVQGELLSGNPLDIDAYFAGFVNILIVAFVLGALCIGAGLCFCTCRFFGFCGGDWDDPEAADDDDEFEPSVLQRLAPRVVLVACGVLLIVLGAIAVWGNASVGSSMGDIAADVARRGAAERDRGLRLLDELRAIDQQPQPYACRQPSAGCQQCTPGAACTQDLCCASCSYGTCNRTLSPFLAFDGGAMDVFAAECRAVAADAARANEHLSTLNGYRLAALGVALAIVVLMIVVAAAASVCGVALFAGATGVIGFVAMAFMWFNIGIAFSTTVAFADICFWHEASLLQRHQPAPSAAALIASDSAIKQASQHFAVGDFMHGVDPDFGDGAAFVEIIVAFIYRDRARTAYRDDMSRANTTAHDALLADDRRLIGFIQELRLMRAATWVLDVFAQWAPLACNDPLDGSVYVWAGLLTNFVLLVPMTVAAWILYTQLRKKKLREDDDWDVPMH